jgi:hypothetical protein
VWAGWDSVREQEKLEAWKILENAAESHTSGAPNKDRARSFFPKETAQRAHLMSELYFGMAGQEAVQRIGDTLSKSSPAVHLGRRSN